MVMIMIDIDMPDNCDECRFNTEYGFCKAMPDNFCGNTDDRKRPEWCPLKEQAKTKVVFGRTKDGEFVTECGNCGTHLDKAYSNCPKCKKELDWNSNQT